MTIKKDAFNKALAILDALGCAYAIIDLNGKQIGTLKIAPTKRKFKSDKPFGFVRNQIKAHWKDLQIGETLEMPSDTIDIAVFQRNLSGFITTKYGAGTHMTSINRKNNVIEVMRIK